MTPSATGMTGQDGRKLLGFTNSFDWSLIVLLLGFVILQSLSAFLGCFLHLTLLWDDECVSTFTW